MGTGVSPARIATKYFSAIFSAASVYLLRLLRFVRTRIFGLSTSQLPLLTGVKPSYARPSVHVNLCRYTAGFPWAPAPAHSLLNSQTVKQPLLFSLERR